MVRTYLTDGFGNNLFQYIAGKLIAEKHKVELQVVPPHKNYYACKDLSQLNINCAPYSPVPTNATDAFLNCLHNTQSKSFNLSGHFEDHTYFSPNVDLIKSWFPAVQPMNKNILSFHLRTSDRLFMKGEFETKPSAQSIANAVSEFNFDELHIISDTPFWRRVSAQELVDINSGQSKYKWQNSQYDSNGKFIYKGERVDPQDSADYFNSIYDALSQYNPKFQKRSIIDDFNFIRKSQNILFEHGTLAWWAAFLSDAKKVGVYGPWRPWKGSGNKNLSDIPFKNWCKWGETNE
jgi:hypothetical protein